jgi:hypothetical protein
MEMPRYSTLDAALDEIAPCDVALKNGNSNHAAMVAEALCALGHPEAVMPWLAGYRDRMKPRPLPREPIGADAWQGALGRRERFSDWALFFQRELDQTSWQVVLDRWVGRLAPGFCAAATHGVIRVGHAARALADRDTPGRRRELADALASWTAAWQRLPENRSGDGAMPPRDAIRRVPVIPPERRASGNIVASLAVLARFSEFAPVVGWVGGDGPIMPQLAELTELFARVCVANAHNVPTAIAFIHAVTSPAALGNIAPHIGEATTRAAFPYAWQSCCALYACYAAAIPLAERVEPCGKTERELTLQAIANGDEHVIKFTEACLNRHRTAASEAYPAAADHIAAIIAPRSPLR